MQSAQETVGAITGTIAEGAYYFDEANCQNCVMDLTLDSGKRARIAESLDDENFALSRLDISDEAVRRGTAVRGSPFNSPETLVQGPSSSIWVLDRLGNRVAVIEPGRGCREYDLPTPFADAGDIIGTTQSVWVSERSAGKIVRFELDGSRVEYSIGHGRQFRNLRIALGGDGRIWYVNDEQVGAIDERGQVTTYADSGPVFWIRDLALGHDGREWVVGLASSYGEGTPFIAAIDTNGRWQRFPLARRAAVVLTGKTGLWVAGDYDSLSFVDMRGHERPVALPVGRMRPKLYAVDAADTVWFSDGYGNTIASATPAGLVTANYSEFGPAGISDMRIDESGNVWIAESHAIEEYQKSLRFPPSGVSPRHLLIDSTGNVWYSDPVADVVGVVAKNDKNKCYAFRLSHVRSCAFERVDRVTRAP